MTSLEEQLANLRAGRAPSPPTSRTNISTSFISIPQHDEIGEDDWDDDSDPKPAAPSMLPPVVVVRPPVAQSPPPSSKNDVDQQQLYERAIEITKSAMAKERNREFEAAVEDYVDAGDIFTLIGRGESDPAVQRTLKKKAFSLLQRAEALADWLDARAARDDDSDDSDRLSTASTRAAADAEVDAAEKHIDCMKQELQQLKYSSQIMRADATDEMTQAATLPTEDPQRETIKRALVNEIHGLLNLPEINAFRTFQPLGSSLEKEQYAQDLKAQVAQLQRELQVEKASHNLSSAMRKQKYSADVEEQRRLQAEVHTLRQELMAHHAALEETRHSIVQITQDKLRLEAQSAQEVQSLQKELHSRASMPYTSTPPPPKDSRWKRTRESRMQWFQGPRGLQKDVAERYETPAAVASIPATRRRSDPVPQSPRTTSTRNLSDGETDSASIWL
ncbi:Aste57867_18703 [Aphanomyces stellatus]|uniref:Aste57867_18703 protein n=1 Tax=Aphanomyces stellatus TaxID=120398 RepID=A0A485LAS9_9STRA|nr:hypothetical protein As57867_018640 [Aphanomyces stellatus]VFT95438.1 Aste57867_18703 [Aphanomyces stellatus]